MGEAGKSGYAAAISEKSWVSLGLVVAFVGFAFWMGVQHSQLSELNTYVRGMIADHEARLRVVEKGK